VLGVLGVLDLAIVIVFTHLPSLIMSLPNSLNLKSNGCPSKVSQLMSFGEGSRVTST
jgi:hypothetical protein